ncbi:hypothetical protein L3X38_010611 [Prunus dulcis]|uniref:Retrotransposon gag domain-containing protein n=1 Tax=Prunus dulcis TaxID=3755 RepID=A0AAD4WFY9_PRUDU|nr:hypothetical protein L3X38_010611 [Prunus dulcis]
MMDQFLLTDYEQIMYRMYIVCVQGNRSVFEYTEEFMRLAERNHSTKIENQKIARYIKGLKLSIQEKIGLQNMWTLQEPINMALKVELLEKEKCQTNYQMSTTAYFENVATFLNDKGKTQQQNIDGLPKTSNFQSEDANEGRRSNVCPERRQDNLIEDVGDAEEEDEPVDDDYAGAEFLHTTIEFWLVSD